MGHLGEGAKITTVSTQKAVFTADNGQHFTIEMSDLAEAVRQVMAVATSERNGLMSKLKFLQLGKSKVCDVGKLGVSSAWLMIQTNNEKTDFQFCFEITDCNNYTADKPTNVILKGYNPHITTLLNHFYYYSDKVFDNILGGYVNGRLTFLIPEFALYDAAMVRVIDDGNKTNDYGFDFTMEFTTSEPNWESRFVAL